MNAMGGWMANRRSLWNLESEMKIIHATLIKERKFWIYHITGHRKQKLY